MAKTETFLSQPTKPVGPLFPGNVFLTHDALPDGEKRAAARYLTRTHNTDLLEVLGLDNLD